MGRPGLRSPARMGGGRPTHVDGRPGLRVLGVGIGRGGRRLGDGEAGAEGGAADGARLGAGRAGRHGPLLLLRRLLLEAQAEALEGAPRAERPAGAVELGGAVGARLGQRGGLGLQPGRGGARVARALGPLRVAAAALEAGLGELAGRLGVGALPRRREGRRRPGRRGRAGGGPRGAALRAGRLARRRRHRRAALRDGRGAGGRGRRAALLGRGARGAWGAALGGGGLARGARGRRSRRRGRRGALGGRGVALRQRRVPLAWKRSGARSGHALGRAEVRLGAGAAGHQSPPPSSSSSRREEHRAWEGRERRVARPRDGSPRPGPAPAPARPLSPPLLVCSCSSVLRIRPCSELSSRSRPSSSVSSVYASARFTLKDTPAPRSRPGPRLP